MDDDKIILRKYDDKWTIIVSKKDYVLAESRNVIQLLPDDDRDEIRTFYKPFWKVVKS